jgi:ubiquinone biosynthesis protein
VPVRLAGVLAGAVADAGFGFRGKEVLGRSLARRARRFCQDSGPSFIKLGQLISVRPDLFPPALVEEMERLRDDVTPAGRGEVRRLVEGEFGRPPEELFRSFDADAVAAASVAQVHLAVLAREARPVWGRPLPAGARVAVKLIRPGAEEVFRREARRLQRWGIRLDRLPPLRRLGLGALGREWRASVERELDLREEGRTADRFAFMFRDHPRVTVPRVVWSRTTRRVLTMEYLEGWHLDRLDEARAAGVDTRALAVAGAEAFMAQVMVHGLYHADLHHANLLVTRDDRIAYLDFGIAGRLSPPERLAIARLLGSLVGGDAAGALSASAALGVRVPDAAAPALRRELGELIGKTLGRGEEGDVRHFGLGLLSLLRRAGISVPPGYGLLVKALVTVEGVSRQLYPDISLVEVARPFVVRRLAGLPFPKGGGA